MYQRLESFNLLGVRQNLSVSAARGICGLTPQEQKRRRTTRQPSRGSADRSVASNRKARAVSRAAYPHTDVGERECAATVAMVLERRGTQKSQRLANLLRGGALEVRGGANQKFPIVKAG
ncbi:hypothetical protein ACFYUD_03745 [Nocardia tengchongensis]|uniref:hypothetical protein n=1 Tax=Nocardia tengchongensis TaxID=2055889 RepID=UPI00368196D7